jgi:hypothetical protein
MSHTYPTGLHKTVDVVEVLIGKVDVEVVELGVIGVVMLPLICRVVVVVVDGSIGLVMLIGRFGFILPALAVAGSLAAKKKVPTTSGTLPTHGMLFVGLLVGVVVVIGALTFFPALSLGPIIEELLMHAGKVF